MSLFSQFATNPQIENAGIEIIYGSNLDGSIPTFIIARTGKSNKAYAKALEKAIRPYNKQIELGTLQDEVAEELYLKVFVETVLKGWRNIQDREGKELPFTKENAIKLLKELPELYDDLLEKSKKASLFREEKLEDEVKN